jgi:pimeloyl-ACP methyl ester carboxylesterase
MKLLKRRLAWLATVTGVGFAAVFLGCAVCTRPSGRDSVREASVLQRGPFEVVWYLPAGPAKVYVLLSSGDGGWTKWEEKVALHLRDRGFAVAGIDCRAYAKTSYSRSILQQDFRDLAAQLEAKAGGAPGSVVYMGFSTGAEQAVPAAADRGGPERLKGVVLISPGERGRYGMTMSDLMMIKPQGPDTFALADFKGGFAGLKVAQIHAEHDPLDSIDWLKGVESPHRLWVYPGGWHTYNQADAAFLQMLDEAFDWAVSPGS